MTDHEHEWRILLVMPNSATAQIRIRCRVSACNEVLLRQNAESMLNEHAKLKRWNEKITKHLEAFTSGLVTVAQMHLLAIDALAEVE